MNDKDKKFSLKKKNIRGYLPLKRLLFIFFQKMNICSIKTLILLAPKLIKAIVINNNEDITIFTSPKNLQALVFFLKKNTACQFNQLIDITAVDYPQRKNRFEIIYMLLSIPYNCRIRIKVQIAHNEFVPTITKIFPSGYWLEREVWDLFGIYFQGNSELRRILNDYGFEGFPLRKDFPTSGFLELRYDNSLGRIVYTVIEPTQKFKQFSFF